MEKEKPPIFGMIQHGGDVVVQMLPDVKQKTIKPYIESYIKPGSTVYTDEYVIYTNLMQLGYKYKTVNHGSGEYARHDDGDGFHKVHVNTQEGCWSLLRLWLRPYQGI